MTLSTPGACLRKATNSLAGALASALLRRPDGATDRAAIDACAKLTAFAVVSGAASALSMPSVLKMAGLGLAGSVPDRLLILLGLVLAVDAWSGRRVGSLPLRAAYAGLLVFAAPLIFVRTLA